MAQQTFHRASLELELEVEADYYPGCPGVHTMPNGDPGYPEEPAELDITKVSILTWEEGDCGKYLKAKQDILESLSEDQLDNLEQQIMDNWEEPDEDLSYLEEDIDEEV